MVDKLPTGEIQQIFFVGDIEYRFTDYGVGSILAARIDHLEKKTESDWLTLDEYNDFMDGLGQ